MTQEEAQAFMAQTVALITDDDGPHFGICIHDEGTAECTIESPDRLSSHTIADSAGVEMSTVEEVATAAGWTPPPVA
jgi:hypothetical protein